MFGEKNFNLGALGYWVAEDDEGYIAGWDWDTVRWGYVPPLPDQNTPDSVRTVPMRTAFGSSHPGVFNAVFADGHARTISFSVSMNVFMEVCSRNDGQVFNPDAL